MAALHMYGLFMYVKHSMLSAFLRGVIFVDVF